MSYVIGIGGTLFLYVGIGFGFGTVDCYNCFI